MVLTWRFEHFCSYKLVEIGIYTDKEHREHPASIPLVAWRYECKCGKELIEYSPSGIRLLQKGLSEEKVVTEWI